MYISGGDDRLSCKIFPRTLRGVAMHWLATLPPQSIRTFGDLATSFASQFIANKTKCLKVANLFDIKQSKGETLKNYLACFNNATIRVNDLDKKFFMKAFQKGLRVGQLSDSLTLRKPLTMEEIRARAKKHLEADRLEVEKQPRIGDTRPTQKGENRYPNKSKNYPLMFTPQNQILHEIYHTNLLKHPRDMKGQRLGPNTQEWCEFHKAYIHSTEDCRNQREEIERLIQEEHLGQYVRRGNEKTPTSPRASRRVERGEAPRENRGRPEREEKQKERSKSL
ncbi:hypothetical protein CR513_44322, partial [Mucuna pruriens]